MSGGPDVAPSDSAAALRGEAERLDAALRAAFDEAARHRAETLAAFRDLAQRKLDGAARQQAIMELDAAERRVSELFAQRRQELERLAVQRREALEALRQAEAEALSGSQGSRIESVPARPDDLARMAEEAEKKAAQAEADRDEKRKPYEADPLFMYLWRRRFGTAEYRAGPLVRYLDRKVARLVGYDAARANYALLNEIPLRLRQHAERLKAEIASARARLAAPDRAEPGTGVEPRDATVPGAGLAEAERRLEDARRRLADLDREYDGILDGAGDAASGAPDPGAADVPPSLRDLYGRVARAPGPEDEAVLRRIQASQAALARAVHELARIRQEMRDLVRPRVETGSASS
jgi:hypothetical protein